MSLSRVIVVIALFTSQLASAAPNVNASAAERSRATPENTKAACSDHLDNDMDGYEDCDDQDCQDLAICAARTPAAASTGLNTAPKLQRPELARKRSHATMRLIAGSLLLGFGVIVAGTSGILWWERSQDSNRGYVIGGAMMDVFSVGMLAAGATFLTLGAGEMVETKYAATLPVAKISF